MILTRIKTALLLGSLSGLIMLLGGLIGGYTGVTMALAMALCLNAGAYFFSDKIVLSLYKAQPLNPADYAWVYEIVKELARDMRIPQPKLWLITTPVANAFATGRNPAHASVALTTGIITLLEKHELRGVLAHELAHVKNRDILIGTIAATLAAAIGYVANMLQYAAFWRLSSEDKNSQKSNTHPVILIVAAVCMPIIAVLIQLAISRSREYLADETGAHTCHDPLALASALKKLHNHTATAHFDQADATKTSTAHLFIVTPLTSHVITSLLSTHPPLQERIKRLHSLYEKSPYQRSFYDA